MVTVAEIARNIGIPATTAREYVGRFKQFFPTRKVSGKRYPMHPNSAETVMRDIVTAYSRNMTTDEVVNFLKEKHPITADVIEEDETMTNSNNSPATTDNSAIEILTRMNNMQMQLMQRMTDVLDRNNQVMERMMNVLDKEAFRQPALKAPEQPVPPIVHEKEQIESSENRFVSPGTNNHVGNRIPQEEQPSVQTMQKNEENPVETRQPLPATPPKKFILPSKEELEKRKTKGWLSRMFG